MSLPRPASYSSSPSKSSLRSVNPHSRTNSRGHLPSPKFDDVVRFHPHPSTGTISTVSTVQQRQQLEDNNEEAIASSSQHTAREQLGPGPGHGSQVEEEDGSKLAPFFTLIADKTTGTHYHPTVHYVFADDDAEIITRAACDQLERDDGTQSSHHREAHGGDDAAARRREYVLILDVIPTATATAVAPSLPPFQALGSEETATPEGGRERGRESGKLPYTLASTSSLSADWQVLSGEITTAPTFDGIVAPTSTSAPSGDAGLMFRIEGTGVLGDGDGDGDGDGSGDRQGQGQGQGQGDGAPGVGEGLEELVRRFEDGLDTVRRVLDQAAHGQCQDQEKDPI